MYFLNNQKFYFDEERHAVLMGFKRAYILIAPDSNVQINWVG